MKRLSALAPSPLAAPRASTGFTLIEILVVLILIGITVGLATLSVGSRGERQAEEEARRLAALIDLASEEAVLKAQELGILFRPDGYEFYLLGPDDTWKRAEDDVLRVRTLPPGFVLFASAGGLPIRFDKPEEQPKPHGYLFSSGERTPFEVELGPAGGPRYRLQVPVIGALTVAAPEAEGARR